MKFGEVWTFKYKVDNPLRKYDAEPSALIIATTKDKIFGVNLNFVPSSIRNKVFLMFNHEIFKNFVYDEDLLEMASERTKRIDFEETAKQLLLVNKVNRKSLDRVMKFYEVKDTISIMKAIQKAFRIYDNKKIKTEPKKLNV